MVLVHGGAATCRYWDAVSAHLIDAFRVIAIDLYGCGATDAWPGPGAPDHDDEAALVGAVIEHLDTPLHVVGHSYGASVTLRAVLKRQEGMRSLVLIEPPMYLLLKQAGREELYREFYTFRDSFEAMVGRGEREAAMKLLVDRFNGTGAWINLSAKVRHNLLDLIEPLIGGFAANADNPTRLEECQTMQIPTLALFGDKTGEPERAMVEILVQNFPHSRVDSIPGTSTRLT